VRALRVILAVAVVLGGLLRPLAAKPAAAEFRLAGGVSAAARAELAALAADSDGQVRWCRADGAVQVRAAEWADRLTDWARRHDVEFPTGAGRPREAVLAAPEAVLTERPSDRSISVESPAVFAAGVALARPGGWRSSLRRGPRVPSSPARRGAHGSRAPPAR